MPGIKTDQGLVPLTNSNDESWTQGLTKLADRSAKYYEAVRLFAQQVCVAALLVHQAVCSWLLLRLWTKQAGLIDVRYEVSRTQNI